MTRLTVVRLHRGELESGLAVWLEPGMRLWAAGGEIDGRLKARLDDGRLVLVQAECVQQQ
jgi:hypothetical protein